VRKEKTSEFGYQIMVSTMMSHYHQPYSEIINMSRKEVRFYFELAVAESEYQAQQIKRGMK